MDILNTISLKSNKKIKINFDGGDLTSDSGLFLRPEFIVFLFFRKGKIFLLENMPDGRPPAQTIDERVIIRSNCDFVGTMRTSSPTI